MRIDGHVDLVSPCEVVGWAVDADEPKNQLDIEIVRDGEIIGRCRPTLARSKLAERYGGDGVHGFAYVFDPEIITPCTVEVLACGRLLPRGRQILGTADQRLASGLLPIIITSTGRSGTTLLMQELAQQPSIVVAGDYPWEMKFTTYAAVTYAVLTRPQSEINDDAHRFANIASEEWRAIGNPWNRTDLLRNAGGQHLISHFRDSVPARLADTLRSSVLDAYRVIAVGQGKTPRFLAEKGVMNEVARHMVRTLFGTVREIVLVRDPRDYLCSAKSFWGADIDKGLSDLRAQISLIPDADDHVLFLRYEDLLLEPKAARAALYSFLGIAEPVTTAEIDADVLKRHATTANPAASIGRWKNDLTPDQATACVKTFEVFMRRFGYK